MRSDHLEQWRGPGTRGAWVDAAGRRHWLYQSDEPLTVDGETVLVRIVYPRLIPILTDWQHMREVWVAGLEGGAYAYRGRFDLVDDEWVVHAPAEGSRRAVEVGRYADRSEAVQRLAFGGRVAA